MSSDITLDTSAARGRILQRIRQRQSRPASLKAQEQAAAEAYVAEHPQGPRPAVDEDRVAHFVRTSERMASTVERVATLADVPAACARYLKAGGLPTTAIAWPTLKSMDWDTAGLTVEFRAPVDADLVGITGCFCAIAETGTLMMLSGPDTFASASLLPETHIAVVPASRVVAGMEDGFELLRSERGEPPRAINFISGPSRTGDIEQTIVLGAHGPYRVHLVIVDGA